MVVAVVDPHPQEVGAEALALVPAEIGMDVLPPSRMAAAAVVTQVVTQASAMMRYCRRRRWRCSDCMRCASCQQL